MKTFRSLAKINFASLLFLVHIRKSPLFPSGNVPNPFVLFKFAKAFTSKLPKAPATKGSNSFILFTACQSCEISRLPIKISQSPLFYSKCALFQHRKHSRTAVMVNRTCVFLLKPKRDSCHKKCSWRCDVWRP